jgi:L-aminopeptidase/D-esterase-like protein
VPGAYGEKKVSQHLLRGRSLHGGFLDPFYEATVPASEEAVISGLLANEEMAGIHGHRMPASPRDRVAQLLQETGVVVDPRSEST